MIHGSCLCGDVAWEFGGPLQLMSHCHCSRCRKTHGATFATYVMGSADKDRLVRGRAQIARWESSPGFYRDFCRRCGSVVPGDPFAAMIFLPAGALDGDLGVKPEMHIFVGSKAPWTELHDDLPHFESYPPGFEAPSAAGFVFELKLDGYRCVAHVDRGRVELVPRGGNIFRRFEPLASEIARALDPVLVLC